MHRDELLLGGEAKIRSGELVLAPEQSELHLSPDLIQRGIARGPLLAAALLLLLIVAMVAAVFTLKQQQREAALDDLTLKLGAMPKVEPMILQKVAPEEAIAKNALVPLTTAPVSAAKPFVFGETGSDAQRAIDCLAATVYYEAANEPLAGQLAVMQVVLNRVRHPAFPKSVCGVVFQGHERQTGCQFSYTCDGSLARRPSEASWIKFRAMAQSMLTGAVYAPVGYATHYHADYVLPYWSSKLEKVHVVGRHIFYRWAGGWGTERAFRAGHARLEALFPKLARISSVHATGDPLIDNAALVMPGPSLVVAPSAAVTGRMTTFVDEEKGTFLMRVEPGMDPAQLPLVAAQACGARDYCKILAWSRGSPMPKAFPVAEAELGSMAFSFLRNKEQGFEKPLWNCAIYPRVDRKQCIRKRVVIEGKEEELIPLSRPEPEESLSEQRADGLRSLSDREADQAKPKPVTASERSLGRRRPGSAE